MNRPFLTKPLMMGLRPAGLWFAKSWLVLCAGLALHGAALAQCVANNLSARTYDTVLTGPGYGTYKLSFPKWNPDSGLLVSVKINALVNVAYGFSLKNVDVMAGSYTIWVGREDQITSTSMPAAYDNITEQKIGVYALNPGDQVAVPPFPFLSNYNNTDSFSANTAPFLGVGRVNFTYAPVTYTNIHTTNNASYSYRATASEVTRFSLTYTYCNAGVILNNSLTAFTAVLQDPASVRLDWSVEGEEKDRLYEIQRSENGSDFITLGTRSPDEKATGYMYIDHPGRPASGGGGAGAGKWYYRLRIIAPGGISYSPIKEVTMGRDGLGKLMLYPNPAVGHINLTLPGDPSRPGDWRVDILTVDGRLVQRAEFFHTNSFFINFRQHLSPGIYFIRATDLLGQGVQVASFRAGSE
ncbi:MAG: T9SS type A sorting domain-containing protein [Chitinophagaceae bacterium]|nr:T9SS type A sorting domain-containing protein [Chitinophagaceae bacterium]